MAKTSAKYRKAIAVLMLILSCKTRSGKLTDDEKRRKMLFIMGCMHCIKRINAEITKKAVYVYRPPPGVVPHGVEDSFWDDDLFNSYFRFRKHEFLRILHAMHLSGKYILCGIKKRLCDIYHSIIDYIYDRYARKLNQFETAQSFSAPKKIVPAVLAA